MGAAGGCGSPSAQAGALVGGKRCTAQQPGPATAVARALASHRVRAVQGAGRARMNWVTCPSEAFPLPLALFLPLTVRGTEVSPALILPGLAC